MDVLPDVQLGPVTDGERSNGLPLVDPVVVDDDETSILAKNIVEKIESSLNYPGQIKVIVIRESRSIETAQ